MRYTLIIITIIWMLMSTILSKSFSNSLLSTYFGRQTKPMVDSMDQLIDTNVDFKVALQLRDRQKFRQLMPQYFDKLYEMPARMEWIEPIEYDHDHQMRWCEMIARGIKYYSSAHSSPIICKPCVSTCRWLSGTGMAWISWSPVCQDGTHMANKWLMRKAFKCNLLPNVCSMVYFLQAN